MCSWAHESLEEGKVVNDDRIRVSPTTFCDTGTSVVRASSAAYGLCFERRA